MRGEKKEKKKTISSSRSHIHCRNRGIICELFSEYFFKDLINIHALRHKESMEGEFSLCRQDISTRDAGRGVTEAALTSASAAGVVLLNFD